MTTHAPTAAPASSPCTCTAPGLCPRFGRQMTPRLHHLCQTRADYREAFTTAAIEPEPDPVDVAIAGSASRLPLGDAVRVVAERTGLAAVARWVGRHSGRDCGCEDRRAWLNAFGEHLARMVMGPQ